MPLRWRNTISKIREFTKIRSLPHTSTAGSHKAGGRWSEGENMVFRWVQRSAPRPHNRCIHETRPETSFPESFEHESSTQLDAEVSKCLCVGETNFKNDFPRKSTLWRPPAQQEATRRTGARQKAKIRFFDRSNARLRALTIDAFVKPARKHRFPSRLSMNPARDSMPGAQNTSALVKQNFQKS